MGDVVEMSKKEAERLLSLGFAEYYEEKAPPDTGGNVRSAGLGTGDSDANKNPSFDKDPRNPEDMNMDELKQELSLHNIPYKTNDNKLKLMELVSNLRKAANEP